MFDKIKRKIFKRSYEYGVVIFLQDKNLYDEFLKIAEDDNIQVEGQFDTFNRVRRIEVIGEMKGGAGGDVATYLNDIFSDAYKNHGVTLKGYKDTVSLPYTNYVIYDKAD